MTNNTIKNWERLNDFFGLYIQAVLLIANRLGVDLQSPRFSGDHLGLQVLSAEEFDNSHKFILEYSKMIHNVVIHNRRNRVYRFDKPLKAEGIIIPRIEIFEPKPGAIITKLRPGIEHIAFFVKDYDNFLIECQRENIGIDKIIDLGGSKFFKTKLIDDIEIEFRNDQLGE